MELPFGKQPTVLVVDDDDEVRTTFDRWLSAEGYAVRTAPNGEAALRDAADADAVIADLRMPVLDGMEFLRALRSRGVLVPVAIITGDYLIDEAVVAEINRLQTRIVFKPLWLDELTLLTRDLIAGVGLA